MGHKFIIHKFKVVSELQFSCIIGLDIITNYGIVPNIQHGYFYFNDDPQTKYDVQSANGAISFLVTDRPHGEFREGSSEKRLEDLLHCFPEVIRSDKLQR